MDQSKASKLDQAKNMFLGFSEALINDPQIVDEYLQDEGYDLEKIDREGLELFHKIELASRITEESIKKKSLFEQAKTTAIQLIANATKSASSVLGQNQTDALRLALHRDFKGKLSEEDIESIMCSQTILALLEHQIKDLSEPDKRSPTDGS